MWTQGVDPAEAEEVVRAVRDFLRTVYNLGHAAGLVLPPTQIRPFGTWYLPSVRPGSPYWGTTWYVDASYDSGRQQVVGTRFLELVRKEPWQQASPHWDLAVIDHDLVDQVASLAPEPRREFVLGTATPELAAVLSVHRLRGLVRPEQRALALRRLVLHHFGQVLGLPGAARPGDVTLVDDQRYCTARCVMRRATTVQELVQFAEQEGRDRVALCPACRHDVIEVIALRGRSPN
jgi:hypothetical protein